MWLGQGVAMCTRVSVLEQSSCVSVTGLHAAFPSPGQLLSLITRLQSQVIKQPPTKRKKIKTIYAMLSTLHVSGEEVSPSEKKMLLGKFSFGRFLENLSLWPWARDKQVLCTADVSSLGGTLVRFPPLRRSFLGVNMVKDILPVRIIAPPGLLPGSLLRSASRTPENPGRFLKSIKARCRCVWHFLSPGVPRLGNKTNGEGGKCVCIHVGCCSKY